MMHCIPAGRSGENNAISPRFCYAYKKEGLEEKMKKILSAAFMILCAAFAFSAQAQIYLGAGGSNAAGGSSTYIKPQDKPDANTTGKKATPPPASITRNASSSKGMINLRSYNDYRGGTPNNTSILQQREKTISERRAAEWKAEYDRYNQNKARKATSAAGYNNRTTVKSDSDLGKIRNPFPDNIDYAPPMRKPDDGAPAPTNTPGGQGKVAGAGAPPPPIFVYRPTSQKKSIFANPNQ